MIKAIEKEEWAAIPDYNGYQISSLGAVKNIKTGKILKPQKMKKGYQIVVLCKGNKLKTFRLNRLILNSFVGAPPSDKHQAAHKNGVKDDDRLSNLYWATPKENAEDRHRHGTYPDAFNHPMAKLSLGDLRYAKWRKSLRDTWEEISTDLGVTADVISRRTRSAILSGEI